ncbi:MAG: hypothetical protein AAGI12_15360 [Pseudomonadota bacterium]
MKIARTVNRANAKTHITTERDASGAKRFYYHLRKGARKTALPDPKDLTAFWEAANDAHRERLSQIEKASFRSVKKRKTDAQIYRANVTKKLKKALTRSRKRAESKSMAHDLTIEWLVKTAKKQGNACSITKIPFLLEDAKAKTLDPYSPSIDRIDSAKGYTKDNVRLVLFAVNVMFWDWGEETAAKVASAFCANRKKTLLPAPQVKLPAP